MEDFKKEEEAFFQAIVKGYVIELCEMLSKYGKEMITNLVRSKNEQGETPLLLAIQNRRVNVVKFLVNNLEVPYDQNGRFLWKGSEYVDILPLYAALISDQLSIVKMLAAYKILPESICLQTMFSGWENREKKIDALELMGAVYILHKRISPKLLTKPYWVQAIVLRYPIRRSNGDSDIHKTPYQLSERARKAIETLCVEGNVKEVMTLREIQLLFANWLGTSWVTQALLVSQRILNAINPGSTNLFTLYYVHKHIMLSQHSLENWRYSSVRTKGDLEPCNRVSLYVMELFQSFEWNGISNEDSAEACNIIVDVLKKFPIDCDGPSNLLRLFDNLLKYADLILALNFACNNIDRLHEHYHLDDRLHMIELTEIKIFSFILFIVRMLPRLDQGQILEFKECVSNYIHLYEEGRQINRQRLLHRACSLESTNPFVVMKSDFVKFLLEVGANPNAVDTDNFVPLVSTLIVEDWTDTRRLVDIFNMLLASGCNCSLFRANNRGLTPFEVLKLQLKSLGPSSPSLDSNPDLQMIMNIPRLLALTCYSAQAIHLYRIPFQQLPSPLHLFVRRHEPLSKKGLTAAHTKSSMPSSSNQHH